MREKLRIVLCTGIDKGIKLEVLRRAQEAAPRFLDGARIHVYDFWETLQKVARESGCLGKRETITALPPGKLMPLRKNACFEIADTFAHEIAEVPDLSKHVAIVVTRTIAPGKSEFITTLDDTHAVFDAEACFNIIDNVVQMQTRLLADPVWQHHASKLQNVLELRQQELGNSERWCESSIGIDRHFLVAAGEPPETILGLLFPSVAEPLRRRRVYLSFPITHATEQIRQKKEEFLSRLRGQWVVFDPFSITEYDRAFGEYKSATETDHVSRQQWLERLGPVTVANDYRLVSQSDGIVVFYPSVQVRVQKNQNEWVEDEKKILSAGVIAEMIHAKNEQRDVQALWLSDQLPSPFFSYYCDKPIFRTEAEFFEHLSGASGSKSIQSI